MLLPGQKLPLNIFEPRYLRMVLDALGADRHIGMIQPRLDGARRGDGEPAVCGGEQTERHEGAGPGAAILAREKGVRLHTHLAENDEDIAYSLETGFTPEFDSFGSSMADVARNMAKLPASDREAIAKYLKSIPPLPGRRPNRP